VWYLSNGINKPFFAELLKAFARETGAGRERIIILALDNAGWHGPQNLPVPEGVRLVYQPSYSPELQPAEHLWPLVVPGGVVVFDEYGIRPWEGESRAVDEFFEGKTVELRKLDWSPNPGAYIVKR